MLFETSNSAPRIAKFEKISFDQFLKDWNKENKGLTTAQVQAVYDAIRLPERATSGSAGYDFYSTENLTLEPGQTVKILTGIRAEIRPDWALLIYPRSSMGFKYRLQLDNTVGVIDSDYYFAENEGHIQIKVTNDSKTKKVLELSEGLAFAQGIFTPYGITVDDNATGKRTGGIGSTDSKK